MPAPLLAVLAQLGMSAWQYRQADKQKKAAAELKSSNFVPPGVREAVQRGRMNVNATQGPATKRGLERLRMSSAGRIDDLKRISTNPGQLQQGVMDVDAREKEAIKDLSVSDASFKMGEERNLQGLLTLKGQYEKESNAALNSAKSALTGASMQNKYNALSQLGEGIVYSLPDKSFDPKGASSVAKGATSVTDPRFNNRMSMGRYSNLTPEQLYRLRSMGLMKNEYNSFMSNPNPFIAE